MRILCTDFLPIHFGTLQDMFPWIEKSVYLPTYILELEQNTL